MARNKDPQSYIKIRVSKIGVTRFLIAVVVLLALANVPAVLFQYLFDDFWLRDPYISLFGLRNEGKIPNWYSACTLLFSSIILVTIAFAKRLSHDRYLLHWSGLAIIFLCMSLDEATAIHEAIGGPLQSALNTEGFLYFAWVIPAIAFLIIFGVFYLRFLIDLRPKTRNLFLIAGIVYVSGVLGMEMVGANYWYHYGSNLTYGIMATVEEILEMSGILVFIYALLDYLERYVQEMQITFGT